MWLGYRAHFKRLVSLVSAKIAMVTARNISFIADGQLLLDDISLSIANGMNTMIFQGIMERAKHCFCQHFCRLIMPQRDIWTDAKTKNGVSKTVLLRRSARDYFEFCARP